jgi:sphingomyelin phosphodiesterase acid-like 3
MTRLLAAIALAASMLLATQPLKAQEPPQRWLAVSDIHFDPFSDAAIVERLAQAPVERWRAIFQLALPQPYSDYGSDTNFPLLESSLEAMHNEVSDPAVVMVTGDFLAHGFRAKFDKTVRNHGDLQYDDFVNKTIAFIADEFRAAFPRAHLIPVIGNNDGYCGDYESTPHSTFLARLAVEWGGSVGAADPNAFVVQFAVGGYYTVPLPAGDAQAVVLNDVFWSPRYMNACGNKQDDPGGDELTWLTQTLHAAGAHPVWVLAHIPPGVDVFSTLLNKSAQPVMMLADRFNDPFVSLLQTTSSPIAMGLSGHTHMSSFRVIGPGATTPITPMLVLPSISPIFGGNPSFTVLDVDSQTARVNDDQVFTLTNLHVVAINPRRPALWQREYDFDSVFGSGAIDAQHLDALQQSLFENDRVRQHYETFSDGESGLATITDEQFRSYWCANVALTQASYVACAMPQVQHEFPAQPSPPPTSTPTPAASPTAKAAQPPSPAPSPTR